METIVTAHIIIRYTGSMLVALMMSAGVTYSKGVIYFKFASFSETPDAMLIKSSFRIC